MYSKNEKLLKAFISEHGAAVEQLRVSYESCHGIVEPEFEVKFFRKRTPEEKVAKLLAPQEEEYSEVLHYNFSSVAHNKEFSRTLLLVELK